MRRLAITALALSLSAASGAAFAASSGGGASVTLVGKPSALGAISAFSIGVRTQGNAGQAVRVLPRSAQGTGNGTLQAAVFGISGEPFQAFSIAMPAPGQLVTGGRVVNFSGFSHDAGLTPFIGGSGASTFAVGAEVQIGEQAGATDPNAGTDNASTEGNASGARPDPFGTQAVANGFLSIIVSYN